MTMSKPTLTTERIRDLYSYATSWETEKDPMHRQSLADEFDQWRLEHDQEVMAAGWDTAVLILWDSGEITDSVRDSHLRSSPYRKANFNA